MTHVSLGELRQRAEYTHKPNLKTGRHGWLRLTPAYSVRMVEELMSPTNRHLKVLDPFCGTATTALCAIYAGHAAVTTDINPFLVWLGQVKTAHYSPATIERACQICADALTLARSSHITPGSPPPIHHIERWWPAPALDFLTKLQTAINELASPATGEGMLLRVAFCRTLIACSNAAFNHQSMSFNDPAQLELDIPSDYAGMFRDDVAFVLEGAAENPQGQAKIILQDARNLSELRTVGFDLVVTSPPYANRMSYIRELRPYMYWLGFLGNGRDAGELDWLAIGGTWGIATSRLNDWAPEKNSYLNDELEEVLQRVATPDHANGTLLASYIRKYCVDMAKHFAQLRSVLAHQARLHYIVGNSAFYGELLSVEKIYSDIMRGLGFTDINITPLRKRNSKRELIEFDVSALWE